MPESIRLENEELNLILKGHNRGRRPTALRLRDDGKVEVWALQVVLDPDGNERVAAGESDGTLRTSMVLEDPSGDLITARSDEQRLLRNRPYEPYRAVTASVLTGVWATYYTCPANSIAKCSITWGLNPGTGRTTVNLRVNSVYEFGRFDVCDEWPAPRFHVTLGAAGIIESLSPVAGNANIFIDVELYSTGDTNTGV